MRDLFAREIAKKKIQNCRSKYITKHVLYANFITEKQNNFYEYKFLRDEKQMEMNDT